MGLDLRLEVAKTEKVDKITELEGYEGVVYEGPRLQHIKLENSDHFFHPTLKMVLILLLVPTPGL